MSFAGPSTGAVAGMRTAGHAHSHTNSGMRWIQRGMLTDAKGSVRGVEWAPPAFGLKLVSLRTHLGCSFPVRYD